ncbi:MAG: 16S rRNA (adenine(1518)-N(6)/adenine(1519)-N(6))-dimethyltransferase RsmA [bacterium]|nr:16S rRNA (adenine(1518)-N(6)/adenine(1519)-N(6))-dimethyltransferase RsmA [bacterium]
MIKAKKSLGQNFLKDEKVLQKILETGNIAATDHIVEIGPGTGVLTKELAKQAKEVTTIELDARLIPMLHLSVIDKYKNVTLLEQDALTFIPPSTPYKVVANIPYYITSPLLNHFLQAENPPQTITLLVQDEVAHKICTLTPKMTVLSLQVALFGTATYIEKVSKNAFRPRPKVDSAIIHIETNPNNREKSLQILKLAKRAFSQRRKKLSNTLPELLEKLISLNLDQKRPQHLTIEDWQKLL